MSYADNGEVRFRGYAVCIKLRLDQTREYIVCDQDNGDQSDQSLRFPHEEKLHELPLRKHAYSNILKILPPKNENFQITKSNIFHISAQNIDCGYSLEPP